MAQRCWLVKQEPEDYSWSQFVTDGGTAWTGVRSFPARLHLRAMQTGDAVLYYHSGETREVVGLATVQRAAYPDPTATEGDWSAVDLAPVRALPRPVSLATIKADPTLNQLALVRQSRLSVMPVSEGEFARLLALAGDDPAPLPKGRRSRP
jgi:predicted RNA-binding protein with PUA-like domain